MKRMIVAGFVVVMAMLGVVAVVKAGQGAGFMREDGPGGHIGPFIDRMAGVLDLTDAQKEKISAILKAEQEKHAALHKQAGEAREQLRKASQAVPFDEAAVRAIAARQAPLMTEMIVSGARVRSEIHALLTPEQRALAEKLGPMMGPRHGHMPMPPRFGDDE